MALDAFKKEIKPGDLVIHSGAGNGYFSVDCVTRVMPKSVEYGLHWTRKVHSEKCIVITEEQAIAFGAETAVTTSRNLKKQYKIEE